MDYQWRGRFVQGARHVRSAFRCLFGPGPKEVFRYLNGVGGVPAWLESDVEQAKVVELGLSGFDERDWRRHYSMMLSGRGLEIGPLHRPMVQHEGMDVEYIDRYSLEELREHYPELEELYVVAPDIVGDAETMEGVPEGSYDFLIAAHVIEHMKNPIGSLEAWCRILKPGGRIYLIVPDKRTMFDMERPRTLLEHLVLDYREPSAERDFEHFLEYARLVHELEGDEALEEAEKLFTEDYSIHFHVFKPSDIVALVEWFSEHVVPVRVVEGPSKRPGWDEFHLMLEKVPA